MAQTSPIRRIAIVGPESTGKSQLSQALATHYHSVWVEEYAREYLHHLPGPYQEEDLLAIAQGQLAREEAALSHAQDWLFCDTNLLVINIWSEYKYGRCHPWIEAHLGLGRYHLHLLTDIDLPWQEDPLREHPHARQELFDIYHRKLSQAGVPFAVVRGAGGQRLAAAIAAIESRGLSSAKQAT
ncbi:MAG: ATPase [Bacteroidetes bacterium]|nr:MAG: ATPase [Bacteroidota bacterium]